MHNPPLWKPLLTSFFVTLALLVLANHALAAEGPPDAADPSNTVESLPLAALR